VPAKHCQALPRTRRVRALNNKDEGGGSNICPAALGQLMDVPKRGLRGGMGQVIELQVLRKKAQWDGRLDLGVVRVESRGSRDA